VSAGPAFLYLHGFASSPGSTKARAFVKWGAARGTAIRALDLRVPSLAELRFSAMKTVVREAIDAAGGPRARTVLIGSSLGGLTAARVAEEDPRVAAVFLMAPAFHLAERWRARLGDDAWTRWQAEGSLAIDDYATKQEARVGWGFVEELARLEGGALPDVRVPTCVVHGVRDEVVPVEGSRRWAEGKRHVKLVELDDGHELTASIERILLEAGEFLRPFGV
jgi:predicted esterase YcpF (UPF0227 family)